MSGRERLSATMQERYEESWTDSAAMTDERCTCGHSPSQHRHVPRQYRRPDTWPCDLCHCLNYAEHGSEETHMANPLTDLSALE